MSAGNFSIGTKRQYARKFHVADKTGGNPLVTVAKNESDAVQIWTRRTGLSASEAVVTGVGNRGVPVNQKTKKETKPVVVAEKDTKKS